MITIKFFVKDGFLSGYEVTGHASGKASGENILCAFVSSACEMTANTITEVLHVPAKTKVDDGFLSVETKNSTKTVQIVLQGLELHLKELQKTYEKDINIIYSEV